MTSQNLLPKGLSTLFIFHAFPSQFSNRSPIIQTVDPSFPAGHSNSQLSKNKKSADLPLSMDWSERKIFTGKVGLLKVYIYICITYIYIHMYYIYIYILYCFCHVLPSTSSSFLAFSRFSEQTLCRSSRHGGAPHAWAAGQRLHATVETPRGRAGGATVGAEHVAKGGGEIGCPDAGGARWIWMAWKISCFPYKLRWNDMWYQ